jgi:hypothetical protein
MPIENERARDDHPPERPLWIGGQRHDPDLVPSRSDLEDR